MADRVGLSASTLRSWDRRYGVGPSERTEGNHRRYSHVDVLRVLTVSRLTSQGVGAQSAATMALGMSEADLVEQHRLVSLPALADRPDAGSGHDPSLASNPSVAAILVAARALDAATLSQLFRRVLRQDEVATAWTTVLAPALCRIGELWEDGAISIAAEHLASEQLGAELRAVTRASALRVAAPPVLLCSADDEQHHLAVLALEAELARRGVACTFLGARLPSSALARALIDTGASRAFVWASLSRAPDEPMWAELATLDRALTLVLGGPGWPHDLRVPGAPLEVLRAPDLPSAVVSLA